MKTHPVYTHLIIITLLTLWLFWPALQFDFVNFDDQVYVTQNLFLAQPNWANWINGSGTGNFHPITMLWLLLDNKIDGLAPFWFHFSSVIGHIINALLVYLFVKKLTSTPKSLALFVALLFAVHPMHIESVAWISSRKDIAFTLFYVAALIAYINALDTKNTKWMALVYVLGTVSMLSKPTAISLPFGLALVYWFKSTKVNVKAMLPLLPLVVIAGAVGVATFMLQQAEAVNALTDYTIFHRIGFAFYGVFYYVSHALVPVQLSAMHPFPATQDMTSWAYLLHVIGGFILLTVGTWAIRKNKLALFGWLFFLLNLVLMLQLISVGRAIVAERYTYISYVGLFISGGALLMQITWVQKQWMAVTGLLTFALIITSYKHLPTWENSSSLWIQAATVYPNDWYPQIGLGNYYKDQGKYNQALVHYSEAVKLAPDQFKNYFNVAEAYQALGNIPQAIQQYNQSIALAPNYAEAYINRGQLWVNQQQYANALADFNQAIQLHPQSFIAYTNRGNVFMLQNQPHQALNDFNQAIAINELYAEAWFNRGTLQMNSAPQHAIADFEQAVQINPGYFDAYNNLGSVYYQMQNYAQAEFYFQQAANIQPQNPSIWLNLAIVQNLLGNYNSAYQSALNSQQLGGNVPATFIEQIKNATR